MAQSSTARTPESVKNELLAAKLLQQSAAANTGPYTSGGVTALKALSGLMGGLQERQAEQANAQGQAQSNAVLAAALKAYAANRNGPAPTFGDAAAASAATTPTRGIPTSAAASAPMSSDARDLAIRTIYGEAGGEPDTGKAGVAAVLKNRLAGGQYGNDMQSVILAPKQFSLWNKGDPAGDNARKLSPDSPSYQKIGAIYDGVMSGQIPDPTGGATHYYNPNVASPGWGPKLAQQNDVRIGNHRFVGTGPAGPNGANTMASADVPAAGAQNISSDTLPPGITPDMVSAPGSPFGAAPTPMAPPPASANSQALAAALRQSVAPPATPLAGGAGTDPVTAPPLTVTPQSPMLNPTPMDQQGGIGGPAPSPQLLASVLKGNGPLQGSSPMMPASAPLPPPGAQSGAQPGNPFGAMPTSMVQAPAQVSTPPAPDLSANGLQMAALGGGDPGMAAVLQAGAQAQAAPASGLSSATMPGMDNFGGDGSFTQASTGADGYTGGFGAGIQPAINGDLPAPQALAGGPAPMDPVAPPAAIAAAPTPQGVAPDPTAAVSTPAPSMPIMARASSNPPQVLAQALRASQPATSPADQPAGDPGLPDTGPMPPPGVQSLANADMPAPGASAAGPASVPPGMLAQALRSAQPLGLAGDGGGDPSSARAFLTQQAQGAQPSVLAQALRQQNGMPAPAQSSGGGFDLGSLFGGSGGNPLANIPVLGSLFGGGQQQQLSAMPTGTPASAVQQSSQPAPLGSGSGPLSFMGGLGGGLFGGQQQSAPAPAVTGQSAIDAALADPRISDSIKMKLMETPEHSYSIAPNGTMYDAKTGRVAGGNFEKPTPQQSIIVGDKAYAFDPSTGSYKEQISSGAATPTGEQKDYATVVKQAQDAGQPVPSLFDYQKSLKQAGATNVTVDQKAENAEAQARGAGLGKRMNEIADDSSKVSTEAIQLARIRDLLGQTNTGPGTAYAEKFRQATGVALDPKTDTVQALNAAIQNLAPSLRVPGSGSQSDTELRNFQSSIPNLQGTPGGNQKILDTLEGAIAYRQQRSAIAQQWQRGDITAKDADAKIAALPSPFAAKPGDAAGQASTTVPTIGNPADAMKLPPGTQFRDPNGVLRTVPGK
jgi:spore germination cell wall hydrolase CwlJ-like protein